MWASRHTDLQTPFSSLPCYRLSSGQKSHLRQQVAERHPPSRNKSAGRKQPRPPSSICHPPPASAPILYSAMQPVGGMRLSLPLLGKKKKPSQLLGLKIFDANGTCRKCQGTEAQHQPFVCSRPRKRGGGRTTICQGWCMYRNREGGQKTICSVCPNCRKPALYGPQGVVEE